MFSVEKEKGGKEVEMDKQLYLHLPSYITLKKGNCWTIHWGRVEIIKLIRETE